MYLHLGQSTVVTTNEVIGIFDMDTSTVSKNTRDYLAKAEKGKRVVNVSYELPKSFVVCQKEGQDETVYISQLATSTLLKRTAFIRNISNIKRKKRKYQEVKELGSI